MKIENSAMADTLESSDAQVTIAYAEKLVRGCQAQADAGIGVYTVDGKMVDIECLQQKAYDLVGEPDPLEWEDKIVAIVEARDGTILDVVRQVNPFTFD